MYFASRTQAGRMLAAQISKKHPEGDFAIVALSDGGVVVGMQIALQLHCIVTMLLIDEIELPREMISVGGITEDGSFTYNHAYAKSEIEEMVSEYRGVIEQEKLEKLREMHRVLGGSGLIRRDLLKGRNVVLVSDGMSSGFSIDLAREYLKTISIKKLIVATPLASISAVDRMHVLADELYCLTSVEDYITTDHYYNTQDVPDHEVIVTTVGQLIDNWA
ncbi:MAG: phosphoribosyltransferase [Candidatus Saccharibacteria bacterium]|nr:phosphoribosyltransferase [Candidatus Saccharibacteria bacterium]